MFVGFNLYVGWVAILIGLFVGAVIGLFFHGDEWLGGYSSWKRRMIRLGHISFLGTGLLNIAFALTLTQLGGNPSLPVAAGLLTIGAITMPTVCFLAAWRKSLRHWFVVPVVCLIGSVGELVVRGLLQ